MKKLSEELYEAWNLGEQVRMEHVDAVEKLEAMLLRYRTETPLGHQPHMIAHEVDAILNRK